MNESAHVAFREEAIPLVIVNPLNNKFTVNEEALSMISSLEGPIGVISVAGLYRTGKSYLLNRVILNKANGFGVGPTINPCTKGIWVWGKPVKGQSPEGEILNILVIDTEGIGALDEDSNHDVRIFSLAIMLSSCFIYNSVGNIDENAISNLSLVINITKHIHLRSTNKEDVDSDEYAQYFPTFLWVVRDFTLQLVDQEGEPISPKEYLELALQPQKGFSEQVENKNRVRRLIQTFFRERECFTMVRPLTKEKDLQNLDKTDMSKLRPEFVEQVLNLRKKVITKLKPKTFHGKAISGSMFVGLLNNYITAINDGCVPNIESAWHSICHQTTVKARVDAFEEYEEGLKNQLTIKFPISQQDLKVIHEGQKASALESYHRRAMGDDTQPALKDLVNRISERYESIKLENKREFERLLLSTLAQQYGVLDAKLKKGEYRSFSEFDKDLKSFQKYFEDLEPDGPNKAKLISEFLVKKVSDASYSFLKMAQKDSEEQGVHFKETREKLEREALEAKDERMKEKNAMSLRISDLETSKAELEVKYGLVEQAVSELKKEKEKLEETLKIEMKSEREESKKIIDELKEFVSTNESASKRLERDIVFERSEFEKEKALLQQKLSFYEKSHAEYTAKEAGLQSNIQKISAELSAQLKETSTRHEEEQRQSQKQVKMMTERIAELEEAAAKAKVEQEIAREHAREKEAELLKSLEETQKKFLKSQQESSLSASKNRVEAVEEMKRVYEEKMKALQKEFEKADGDSKERDDRIKAMKTAAEKEKALYNQNIQFLEMQLTELRKQMEDQKKIHEVAMKALEGNPSLSKGEVSKQISELKELHKKEKSQLEGELENTRKRLTMEIVSLHDKQEELEKKSEEENKKWRETQRKLKNDLEAISDERDKLKEQCLEAEATKHKVVSEAEKRFAARILTLEEELERTKDKNAEEVEAMQSASEESLRQLKAFYEGEKLRLEKKIQTEKEKQEKRFNTMVEEYEAKAQEDQREHEEEIENMQEEMKELEIQNMATIQHLEQEVTLKQQELEMAEKQLKEIRDAYESLQINSQASLDQLTSNFAEERRGLNRKIEVLSGEMNNKERELFALNKSKEAVEQALNKKETQLLECKAAFEVEKKEMDKKVEDARSSLQRVSDEFMEQKIQYGKEVALASQQNEFMNKKIEDLQKLMDESSRRTEERVRAAKEEHQAEIRAEREKLIQEKESFELRYESKRKALKEIESNLSAKIGSLEKEKTILQEKLGQLDAKKAETEKRLQGDISALQIELQQMRDNLAQERKAAQAEMEKLRKKAYDVEMEMSDVESNYEKDKALWEGKFTFLEHQRDQMKSDLADAQRNFEIMLQKFQKFRSADKEESESSQSALVASIEQRYAAQLAEVNEGHKSALAEMAEKHRRQEKEIKALNEKILSENSGKLGSQSILERKISELLESEKRLQGEIAALKGEQDGKMMESHKMLDSEKAFWKKKLHDAEMKAKESESRKSNLLFEHEKERAKWIIEKDHLMSQRTEFLEAVDRLEKKKEQLLRENEKLKNENRTNRKLAANANNLSTLATNIYLREGRSSGNTSFNKENRHASKSPFKLLDKGEPDNTAGHQAGLRPFSELSKSNRSDLTNDFGKQNSFSILKDN